MLTRKIALTVGLSVLVAMPALAGTGLFRSSFTSISSSNATGIAIGDFDGDSNVDVITANAGVGGNVLTIQVGFSDGTLSRTGQEIELNGVPNGMIQGKFDGDDLDDLIVANGTDNSISFLKGLGNTDYFAPPSTPMTVGQSPAGFAAADIDGDGKLDLIVANEGGDSSPGSVSVLHGVGDGTFVLIQQTDPTDSTKTVDALPAGLGTHSVALGDVDGTPGLDIVAVNSRDDKGVTIFKGLGGGLFAPLRTLTVGAAPQEVALSDVNGDGKLDMILADGNADAVEVRLGDANAMFAEVQHYDVGTSPNRLRMADLSGDGKLDIVTSNSRSGDVSILVADGAGGFLPARNYVADSEPQVMTIGDLNADQLPDVVAATQGGDDGPSVAVLRNRGGAALQAVRDLSVGSGPAALAAADLDDDALPDLVVSGESGQLAIFYAGSDGLSVPVPGISTGGRSLGVLAVDLDGDALPDLAVSDTNNNRVAVLRNLGGRRFADPVTYATSPNPGPITSGDFNGDHKPDLAVSALGTNRTCRGGTQPGASCTQDSDCHGGTCVAPGFASVLLQQSNGTFGPAHTTPVEETPLGIVALDANCDGMDDLVVANEASNTVSVLRSAGDGTFTIPQTLSSAQVGQGPISLARGDFNRDGVTDFAVSDFVTPQGLNSLRIFLGSCSGPFQPVTAQGGATRPGDQVVSIVARDFTGDQIVDIAVVNQTSNAIRVVTGLGDGRFALTPDKDGVSRMPIAIAAADFNGDGRYDAVTANSDSSARNVSELLNCARDPGCDPFRSGPPGTAALRGDANNDGIRSAADLVAVSAEIMDRPGEPVEEIAMGDFGGARVSAGVDANGDGRVDAQDRHAVARRLFDGA